MKRGPKAKSIEEKKALGTYEHSRDGRRDYPPATDPPAMPDFLPTEAQAIWHEELPRVMRAGIGEADSSLFATYCCLLTAFKQLPISSSMFRLETCGTSKGPAGMVFYRTFKDAVIAKMGTPVHVAKAGRGDIVIKGNALGICVGKHCWFLGDEIIAYDAEEQPITQPALISWPTLLCDAAWKIGIQT